MTDELRIECPHCTTKLKLKNPSALGKKLRCPKCNEAFVAEAAPAPTADEEFFDNLSSLGSDLGEPVAYSAAPPIQPRKKSSVLSPQGAGTGASGESAKKRKTSRFTPTEMTLPAMMWPVFGLAGGMVGGLIWVVVGYFVKHELGWIAWGVGSLVGLGVRIAAGDRKGYAPGLLAVAISLVVILGSKFTVAYLWTYHIVENFTSDTSEDGAKRFLAITIAEKRGEKGGKVGGNGGRHDWSELKALDDFPPEIREETEERWQSMSEEEQTRMRENMSAVGTVPRVLMAIVMFPFLFGFLDILWFFLASITAFRLGSGSST